MCVRWLGLGVAVAVLCLAVAAQDAMAKKPKEKKVREKPVETTVTGMLSVQENDDGKVTGMTLAVDENTTYTLIAGRQAKKLQEMNGKKLEVVGFVMKKKDKQMLRVKSFKAVQEEEKKEAKEEDDVLGDF